MKLDKSFCLFMFLCISGIDGAQITPCFERITNRIFRLNCAQLIREPVRSENKRLCTAMVDSTSIATLFSLLKVLRFHNQSLH